MRQPPTPSLKPAKDGRFAAQGLLFTIPISPPIDRLSHETHSNVVLLYRAVEAARLPRQGNRARGFAGYCRDAFRSRTQCQGIHNPSLLDLFALAGFRHDPEVRIIELAGGEEGQIAS